MSTLSEDIDIRAALLAVKTDGASHVPGALHDPFYKRLQNEIESGPFSPMPDRVGRVTQEVDSFMVRGSAIEGFPLLEELREGLVAAVKHEGRGIKGVTTWKPNLIMVQRFKAEALGIAPHMDGRRFAKLVAIFTTKGNTRFTVCKSRKGDVLQQWDVRPGSLVLLRAPGFAGLEDGRPFHRVEGPKRGERYSIAFRLDTK